MPSYTITTTAAQDAALAELAQEKGVTPQQFLDGAIGSILGSYVEQRNAARAERLGTAYQAATPAVKAQVRTLLGVS